MKSIGFIFVIAGIIVAAVSKLSSVSSKLTFVPKEILTYGSYIGAGLVVVGIVIFLISRGSSGKEVPIYEGKRIVGYRRA